LTAARGSATDTTGMSATRTERLNRPVTLYFVRHAQALHDPDTPDSPLSELGFAQAGKTAARLAREPFDCCYVSSLRRARQTADKILAVHDGVRRVITDDIQEVSRFHFCPIPPTAIERFRTVLEAEHDVLQRFVNRLRHAHKPGESALLVCHGNTIRTLIPMLCNRTPSESVPMEIYNASISILDLFPSGSGLLRLANSVEHLAPDQVTETAALRAQKAGRDQPASAEAGIPSRLIR
jgi:broad specificity phosphatase PhoE